MSIPNDIKLFHSNLWNTANGRDKIYNDVVVVESNKKYATSLVKPNRKITDYRYMDNNGTTPLSPDVLEYMNM